jgi:hypothetical protein
MGVNTIESTNKPHHLLDWRNWVKGIIAAGIGGGANAITLVLVDPLSFNLQEGFKKLLMVAGVSALTAIGLYLKQSPIPQEKAE